MYCEKNNSVTAIQAGDIIEYYEDERCIRIWRLLKNPQDEPILLRWPCLGNKHGCAWFDFETLPDFAEIAEMLANAANLALEKTDPLPKQEALMLQNGRINSFKALFQKEYFRKRRDDR